MPYNRVNKNFAAAEPLPSLKRKRQSDQQTSTDAADSNTVVATCFTNAAFSSTPKKLVARRRTNGGAEVSNLPFVHNPCMEVKSIADIVQQTKAVTAQPAKSISKNPYEVVRKPPKKKKREAEIVEACFENPALNLEMPEKQFNPYEVMRKPAASAVSSCASNCFVNEALNLRTQDAASTRNPFEIYRCSAASALAANPAGVENLGLEEAMPTDLKIGLPFKPTVGCRIDFSNLPMSQLTPSKLLAEKLVFSPVPGPKRSLGSVSEESTMDIGKELDCYQLELENSINEAKMRRTAGIVVETKPQQITQQVELEEKITFMQKLTEIVEEADEEEHEEEPEGNEHAVLGLNKNELCSKISQTDDPSSKQAAKEDGNAVNSNQIDEKETSNANDSSLLADNNADVAYESDSDVEELDFKTPAPFMRVYRRPTGQKLTVSKESLHSNASSDSTEHKKSLNVGNLIRTSIRKLMHSNLLNVDKSAPNANEAPNEKDDAHTHMNAYKLIRNSFRRHKDSKQPLVVAPSPEAKAELSIIDTSERTMKLRAESPVPVKKHSLRNSIRRSTREVMKSVFHKNQNAYDLAN